MTQETITARRAQTGLYTAELNEESAQIETTTTVVFGETNCKPYNHFSLTWENRNAAQTVTGKVYVSNKVSPIAIGGSNWTRDWAQLGTDITVGTTTTVARQWEGQYMWIGVTATATAQTSTDNNAYLKLSRS